VIRSRHRARHASRSHKRALHVLGQIHVQPETEPLPTAGAGLPPELEASIPAEAVDVCRAAVDPLEIAATLEASGVTSRVAAEQFGEPDVFHLGRRLFDDVPFEVVPRRETGTPLRPGSISDLGRGVLYTMPALTFATALTALHLQLAWWVSPLALVFGWAVSQAVSVLCYSAIGRGEQPGWVMVWGTAFAGVAAAGLGAGAHALMGSGPWTAAVVGTTALYLSAFAVLLALQRVVVITVALVPSVVVSLLYLAHRVASADTFSVQGRVVFITALLSLALTVGGVIQGASGRWWRPVRLAPHDRRAAIHHALNGMCSGVAVASIFVMSSNGNGTYRSLAAFPVMVTLGALDWHVRSYQARAAHGLKTATSTTLFARTVLRAFARSFLSYVVILSVAAVGLAAVAAARGSHLPLVLVGADVLLGATLFVGLIVSACTRIDQVVRSWILGLSAFGVSLVGFHAAFGTVTAATAQVLICGAIGVTLVTLLAGTGRTLTVPSRYA
jgi:hypothetical protein